MSEPLSLTVIAGGITRLRVKGAALRNSLFDALNGYVTMQGTVKARGGTIRKASLSQVTKGLVSYQGAFHVFAHTPTVVPGGYVNNVLVNPVNASLALKKIHFAVPFMGFLYVAAEFSDSSVYHYWLQTDGVWQPNTVYMNGDYVSPTVANGFAFAATRREPPHAVWAPNNTVALNDIVEPSVYNGYMFKAIDVTGSAPHTGSVEPAWPNVENAHIQEFGDFGTTSSSSTGGTSTALAPGTTITDRYGNAGVFSSNIGTAAATAPTVEAAFNVSIWRAGTLYQPGAVVQPSTGQGAFINAIPNGDFEAGDDGNWVFNTPWAISSSGAYQGTKCATFPGDAADAVLLMVPHFAVTPGQSVTLTAYLNPNNSGADLSMWLDLKWYNASDTLISTSEGTVQQGGGYRQVQFTASAPATAAFCRAGVRAASGTSSRNDGFADLVSWNLETPAAVSNFLFEAVQATAATSGSAEPTWPVVEGNTVVDGGVTWQAIGTSIITWQALPIMKSGGSEPTWPTSVGLAVSNGNMSWVCADRRITDSKCPNTKYVAINSSKIFCGDQDIVAFSATTNPLDWSSANDAGFIPFGLNNFGSEPVSGLGLYRSNLLIFNSIGYQMWQTDEDPTNMAILDSSPVGCIYPKSIQPVNNDAVFLSIVGQRSIGIAGASTNLQAGNFGKAVDPLVKSMLAGLTGSQEPRGLFYPGAGQYWNIFGLDAIVLTQNGTNAQNWSRYTFPYEVTDWTVSGGVLYLRVTNGVVSDYVWQYDEGDVENPGTLVDDSTGNNIAIPNLMWWPYLDLGPIGIDKMMEGFDMACDGEFTISFGYNQRDMNLATDSFTADGDTLDGVGMVPFPVTSNSLQPRISFTPGQQWEWQALNLYLQIGAST